MITQAARYAVRSMIYLGSLDTTDYVPVRTISEELKISSAFLAKILKNLISHGMVDTYRGPNGGVRLARSANTITVRQVIESIDGDGLLKNCVLGLPECSNETPCPMHVEWAKTRKHIKETFDSSTIAKLGESFALGGIRLRGNDVA